MDNVILLDGLYKSMTEAGLFVIVGIGSRKVDIVVYFCLDVNEKLHGIRSFNVRLANKSRRRKNVDLEQTTTSSCQIRLL